MTIFIEGVGIAEYRSFGTEIQRIGPFRKINIFIGQNNSGKSNILRFLVDHYRFLANVVREGGRSKTAELTDDDRHLGSTSGKFRFAVGLPSQGAELEAILQNYQPQLAAHYVQRLERVLSSPAMTHGGDVAWFDFASAWRAYPALDPDLVTNLQSADILKPREWQEVWAILTKKGQGNIAQHWIPETVGVLSRMISEPPSITMVPAIRQIDASQAGDDKFSGAGFVDRLARMQNPDVDRIELKARFDEINRFVRNVVGSLDATLEIPYARDRILVHMDGKTLPLASLGTGIHEVIILAAAATVLRNQVLCLEEPEIHLHPTLQRKLLLYLYEHTDNQYFIATHSAHLLNFEDAAVFHVTLENGQSIVRQAINPVAKANICADLGYHASDLLQANCIIWVEGPSDRIYLNHWIRAANPDLIEGLHYSIMFYGGRLLAHLTAHDPEVDEFISLRRLNRNITILIDSDRSNAHQRLNQTKRRVREEFDAGPGFAWITQGREIENYIPGPMMGEVIGELYADVIDTSSKETYDDCLQFKTNRKKDFRQADKMKVARAVASRAPDMDVLDLRSQMNKLVEFIRKSNPDS